MEVAEARQFGGGALSSGLVMGSSDFFLLLGGVLPGPRNCRAAAPGRRGERCRRFHCMDGVPGRKRCVLKRCYKMWDPWPVVIGSGVRGFGGKRARGARFRFRHNRELLLWRRNWPTKLRFGTVEDPLRRRCPLPHVVRDVGCTLAGRRRLGMWLLLQYESTRRTRRVALAGPVVSLSRRSAVPTLVVFAHPRCPCTRSTLDELPQVLTRYPERLRIRPPVRPAASADRGQPTCGHPRGHLPWGARGLGRGGAEANASALRPPARRSYGPDGQLLFRGGLTERGAAMPATTPLPGGLASRCWMACRLCHMPGTCLLSAVPLFDLLSSHNLMETNVANRKP